MRVMTPTMPPSSSEKRMIATWSKSDSAPRANRFPVMSTALIGLYPDRNRQPSQMPATKLVTTSRNTRANTTATSGGSMLIHPGKSLRSRVTTSPPASARIGSWPAFSTTTFPRVTEPSGSIVVSATIVPSPNRTTTCTGSRARGADTVTGNRTPLRNTSGPSNSIC